MKFNVRATVYITALIIDRCFPKQRFPVICDMSPSARLWNVLINEIVKTTISSPAGTLNSAKKWHKNNHYVAFSTWIFPIGTFTPLNYRIFKTVSGLTQKRVQKLVETVAILILVNRYRPSKNTNQALSAVCVVGKSIDIYNQFTSMGKSCN